MLLYTIITNHIKKKAWKVKCNFQFKCSFCFLNEYTFLSVHCSLIFTLWVAHFLTEFKIKPRDHCSFVFVPELPNSSHNSNQLENEKANRTAKDNDIWIFASISCTRTKFNAEMPSTSLTLCEKAPHNVRQSGPPDNLIPMRTLLFSTFLAAPRSLQN